MNIGKTVTGTRLWITTSYEYDADHTPKKERRRSRPNDEELRSLMETMRDALAEQGIVLESWIAEQGPRGDSLPIRAQRTEVEFERHLGDS